MIYVVESLLYAVAWLSDGCLGAFHKLNSHQFYSNPKGFFDITADGAPLGRIVMELRADVVPKTAGKHACDTATWLHCTILV